MMPATNIFEFAAVYLLLAGYSVLVSVGVLYGFIPIFTRTGLRRRKDLYIGKDNLGMEI